jgi:hypothetical protein
MNPVIRIKWVFPVYIVSNLECRGSRNQWEFHGWKEHKNQNLEGSPPEGLSRGPTKEVEKFARTSSHGGASSVTGISGN